jgi:hypothetical protein
MGAVARGADAGAGAAGAGAGVGAAALFAAGVAPGPRYSWSTSMVCVTSSPSGGVISSSPSTSATMAVPLSGPPRSLARSTMRSATLARSSSPSSARSSASGTMLDTPSEQTSRRSPRRRCRRPMDTCRASSRPMACRMMFFWGASLACSALIAPMSTSICTKLWSLVICRSRPARSRYPRESPTSAT